MKKYDVIVIGAGSAGLGCSGVANFLGLKTLLIEKDEDHFGGDCTNYGCVPSKALIHIANHFYHARKSSEFGMEVKGKADMKKVLDYIHKKQDIIRKTENASALRDKGIDVVIGEAKFTSTKRVSVAGDEYSASIIFLCTGSLPAMVDIDGMDTMKVYTNENIFHTCDSLPEHLLVIGGGPIGCELGQAFARLGSKVTIVNRGERLLDKEPTEVSKILQQRFEWEDIQVLNEATIEKFSNKRAQITIKDKDTTSLSCDAVLVAIGREIPTQGLQLEKAEIELTDKGKIRVNEYLQSTNKRVYVIGDAAGSYQFSHGAEKMVRQVWRNLLIPIFKKKNTLTDLSWVTFTDPQVAHFGLSEKDLKDSGTSFYRQDQDMEHEDRAIIQEYQYGKISLWLDAKRSIGRKNILSGSMIAPLAGELIQELQLAKHAEIPIKKIGDRVYPYPVAARINQKAVRGVLEKSYTEWKIKIARTAFRFFN